MTDMGSREPQRGDAPHAIPGQAMPLAAATQVTQPMPRDLLSELTQGFRVGRDAIVLVMPSEDLPQPVTLLRDGIVTPAFQLALDFLEFGPQALGNRVPHQ
jgi:hypothetical protein